MKRKILALMALVFLMSAALALPAWAETVTQDGLVVTLTTDKESYDSMNAVNASLTITNTNSYAVKNVSAEITAPNGYVLHGDAEEEHGTLRAGQSQTQETAVYRADYAPKLPKTGDGSHFVLWVVLFILCVAGVCAFAHNPHAKRFLSLLLCTAILAPYALRAVPVRAETAESTIAVSKSVKVAGKSVTLTGTVKYEATAVSKNAVRTTGETPVSDLSYFSKNGEIIITGYKGNSTELVIPSEIDGKPVTNIGTGYWQGISGVKNIKILELPDTVKIITANAFQGCENLESVRFSKALSYIGGGAFVGCTGLKEIDIHTTGDLDIATNVAENGGTFGRCENLERVSIVCDGNLNLSGASGASAHYQGGGAFGNCYDLETVYLSAQENLYVGDCSFLGCDFMTTVELDAKNLAVIGNSAFTNCLNRVDKETSVVLPREAQVRIDDNAFSSCQMLNKIVLLKNVTEIGSNAFSHCGTTVGGLTIIGNRGSYAEKYVEDHNKNKPNDTIKFKAVEDTCDHYDAIHNKEYYYDPLSDKPYYGWDEDHYSRREEGHQIGYLNNRCCKQCNAVIADSIVLYGNTVYSHTMANGVCSLCGYQAPQLTPASITDFALRENSATIGNSVHVKSGMAYGGDYYLRKVQISVFTDNTGAHGYYSDVSKEFAYGEATSYDLSKLGAIAINGQFTCEAHKTEEAFPAGEAMVMVFVSVYNEDGTAGENTFGADAADTVTVVKTINVPTLNMEQIDVNIYYTQFDCSVSSGNEDIIGYGFREKEAGATAWEADLYESCNGFAPNMTVTYPVPLNPDTIRVFEFYVITADGEFSKQIQLNVPALEDVFAVSASHTEGATHTFAGQIDKLVSGEESILKYGFEFDEEGTVTTQEVGSTATSVYPIQFTYDKAVNTGKNVKYRAYAQSIVGTVYSDWIEIVDTICSHEAYTDVYNANIPIQYTDNKDGKTHIWQSGYDRICDTCHANMGVVYGKENIADHDYTNGDVCPCGYDRSNCQHTPSDIKTYNRHLFAPLNEKQHQTIAIVWDMVCSTCGKTYEEIDTVGDENNLIGLPYDHVWEDGKCKVLGCEYQCEHAFEDIMLPDGNHKAENGIWESKGESGHWCKSIEYWEKCVNCGLEQKYTKIMPYGEEVQPHMLHVEKIHYDYNDEEHWIVVVDKECGALGCIYSVHESTSEETNNKHIYKNSECVICGKKKIDEKKNAPKTEENQDGIFAGNPYLSLEYKGNSYPLFIPQYDENTKSNSAENDGWTTIGIQEIELDNGGYSIDWSGWIGGVNDLDQPIDDDDGQLPFGNEYSSGIVTQGIGNVRQGSYTALTIIQMLESIYEYTTIKTVRVVYQQKGNQRRAFFEMASVTGSQEKEDFDFVESLINRGQNHTDPLFWKYGSRMLYDWRNIADEELREKFPDVDFRDGYVYNLKIKYSEDWMTDKFFVQIGQDENGNWLYGYEIKQNDEYILVGSKKGSLTGETHIIDIKPKELTVLKLSKDGIRTMEDMYRQLIRRQYE